MRKPKKLILFLFLALGSEFTSPQEGRAASPQQTIAQRAKIKPSKSKHLVYENKQYGFDFSLPETWRGFRILVAEWGGGVTDNYEQFGPGRQEGGPLITIRNPLWTEQTPYQDIPIMIFTRAQWKLVEDDALVVSAAPVGPGEIGRNAKYVFALPPRFNVADAEGREEVGKILRNDPIRSFKPR